MNTLLYSVDRRGFYREGQELTLMSEDNLKRPFWNLPGRFSEADLRKHLNYLFPDGLSYHGWQYLLERHDFIKVNASQAAYVSHEITVELLFEYIRRANYPDRHSRFQSFFAWESLDDAMNFREGEQPIYRLECNNYFRADQVLLTTGVQNVAASFCAHKYWAGQATEKPRWEYLLVPPVVVAEKIK